jgi:AraC-like DNA-binding protein
MKFIGYAEEYLYLITDDDETGRILKENPETSLTVLWFTDLIFNELIIDGKEYVFRKNDIIFLTEFHKIQAKHICGVRLLQFNRPFYCILEHDIEIGCKGVLFFGASQLPNIQISDKELEKFETLWKMFTIEMQSDDNLQIEMLQMMLKRYLILCTRLYKSQVNFPQENRDKDIIREFNFLVEKHFKTKHTVAEYADLLHKSPKTISNTFIKLGSKSPLQYIQDRKMLEAKRLLYYSSMQIKEIAYDIGFDDIQAFSRFFKKQECISPSMFKKNRQLG